jgi:HPt (histidine-containing phosphotransfer) domain-containing protein
MALPRMTDSEISFGLPGGERCDSAQDRPVDLLHLARQTLGDRALESEVLALFARQAAAVAGQIEVAAPSERLVLAHALKGSARSIGAFRVAELSEEIEANPADKSTLARLAAALAEVRDFIAAISR